MVIQLLFSVHKIFRRGVNECEKQSTQPTNGYCDSLPHMNILTDCGDWYNLEKSGRVICLYKMKIVSF